MTETQWRTLVSVIKGEHSGRIPVGFIIDSPWLPNWYGISLMDYFSSEELWFEANRKAIDTFPEIIFLPGYWSEYGMCTEPSAFGSRCTFSENEFPHAHPSILSIEQIAGMTRPDPGTDGLLPFMLKRLILTRKKIEAIGHAIRFSVSRGPLNIASYLMGMTEFMLALMTHPAEIHRLLRIITDFLTEWHRLQIKTFDTIDGMLVLDDIIGFLGEDQFVEFGLPYFKELYSQDVAVRFLHNDAPCHISAPYLQEMGINFFNMGFDVDLSYLRKRAGESVAFLGNIPPRDVLANGTDEQIREAVKELMSGNRGEKRLVVSCGGGMPPGVSTGQIRVFLDAINTVGES